MKPLTRNSKPAGFTLPSHSHCLCKFFLHNWKFQRIFLWQIFTKLQHHIFIKQIYLQKLAKFLMEKNTCFGEKCCQILTQFSILSAVFFWPIFLQVGKVFFYKCVINIKSCLGWLLMMLHGEKIFKKNSKKMWLESWLKVFLSITKRINEGTGIPH